MRRSLPVLGRLPAYDRGWLTGDVVAGLTVWALVVPESMAYAAIAGVPVQVRALRGAARPRRVRRLRQL